MKTRSSPLSLLWWPVRALRRLLASQVRLRRDGGRWRLVFEDAAAVVAPAPQKVDKRSRKVADAPRGRDTPARKAAPEAEVAAAAPATPPSAPDEGGEMQTELHRLLAQHGATRQLMRHLAYLERTLRLMGPDSLPKLPLDVLKKSLAQLEDLVSDWSSPGLAQLRLQLTMVVADKEDEAREFRPSQEVASDFGTSRRVQVSEASASDFEAAAQAWSASPGTAPESAGKPGAAGGPPGRR